MFRALYDWMFPQIPGKDYPNPISVKVMRIPANGSAPHLVNLMTTHEGLDGPCCFLFHIPDFRKYWGNSEDVWRCKDLQATEFKQHPVKSSCDGLYYIFYCFSDITDLPEHKWRPGLYGDIFVVKMQPEEYGLNAWALYDDVEAAFLQTPTLRNVVAHI